MAQETISPHRRSTAYNLFIFVLTIISLVIMVVMLLPLNDAAIGLLQVYDNLICVIFLVDFFIRLSASPKKSDYLIKGGGWLDLLGSIPSFGVIFKYSILLRLARLSRLVRIMRILRGKSRQELVNDVVRNRSRYTGFITILLAIIILSSASVLVLQFESESPEAKITTGWDALWYSIVTITTVGYGDYYPVTFWGRITAMFIMVAGVGIIGVLASLLSNLLIGGIAAPAEQEKIEPVLASTVEQDIISIKNELIEMRHLLEKISREGDKKVSDD
jgi:voltage-gated potassium channel